MWETAISWCDVKHFYQDIFGFFWFEEAYTRLLRTLPDDRPSVWVELGCFMGKSTAWLGVEIINSGKPVTLHVVDTFQGWEGVPQGAELERLFDHHMEPLGYFRRPVGSLLGMYVYPETTVAAAEHFAPESVDVVWVDAGHSYEDCKADIDAWWPKLKPGGWMGGDDFLMTPVCKAVCERFAPSGYILVHGWASLPDERCWPSWLARKG